jgi:hypothetical protein
MRAPSQEARAADVEAVDRGEGRTIACLFRGTYGIYPRRFKQKMLDLTSDSLVSDHESGSVRQAVDVDREGQRTTLMALLGERAADDQVLQGRAVQRLPCALGGSPAIADENIGNGLTVNAEQRADHVRDASNYRGQ